MTKSKLGDSYDIVKRFFRDTLSRIAPLTSDPYFLESSLSWSDYERATGIPLRSDTPAGSGLIGVLLDPHTGIHVSDRPLISRKYASTRYITNFLDDPSVVYCVVFDQAFERGVRREDQIERKLKYLAARDVVGFYYVSHATFLFAARRQRIVDDLRDALRQTGLPEDKFRELI